jgi:hypothetical protein
MQRSNNLAERLITSATSVGLKLVFEKVEHFGRKVNNKCYQCGTLKSQTILSEKLNNLFEMSNNLSKKSINLSRKSNNLSKRSMTSATSVGIKLVFEKVEQFVQKANDKCN